MNDNLFRIIAAVIFFAAASISIYHRRKADRTGGDNISLEEEGLWMTITLRGLGLLFWFSYLAFMINPAWLNWSRVDLPEWARWVGVGMGAFSVFLAYWVFSNLGNNVTPTVVTRANHSLVTTGPYRYVRHPLYTMGFFSYGGFALIAENWFIVVIAVLGLFFLNLRSYKEEANLIARFGDGYRQYMRRTGKYFPRLAR
jgi:protein-S-isoprenylcysteine O-methyltransferase Ste14